MEERIAFILAVLLLATCTCFGCLAIICPQVLEKI